MAVAHRFRRARNLDLDRAAKAVSDMFHMIPPSCFRSVSVKTDAAPRYGAGLVFLQIVARRLVAIKWTCATG